MEKRRRFKVFTFFSGALASYMSYAASIILCNNQHNKIVFFNELKYS